MSCGMMYLGNMSVPFLSDHRGWEKEMGQISALFLFGMVFGRVLGAWLLSRVNNLYALHICMVLLVITTFLYGFVVQAAVVITLRWVQGLVLAVTLSLSDIMVMRVLNSPPLGKSEVPRQQYAKGMGYYSVAGTISLFLFGTSSLYLMQDVPFPIVFGIVAVLITLLYVWMTRFMSKNPAFIMPYEKQEKGWSVFVLAAIPLGLSAGGVSAVFTALNSYSQPISAAKGLVLWAVTGGITLAILLGRSLAGWFAVRPQVSIVLGICVIWLGVVLLWRTEGIFAYMGILAIGFGFGITIILFFDVLQRQMNPQTIGAAFSTFSIICFDLLPALVKWQYGKASVEHGYENVLGLLVWYPVGSLVLFLLYIGIKKQK
ncbi:MFS transporter [Shimazuella sp. AN120528]|uniref:MFS transporter n=1 Tax=Shimazuella soli TaxID=1892854 RepID=UPI001F109EDE|nr:MFS transporter [Shimazuella soli]MCH5584785.1 MFS transporter [Shimazuella soli]